ncbi:hypothetical protein LCGC14_0535760 [marine sediment metagenome]|uniref:Uncharacterized protein n=1 Tax=marine sediment metagenome TaxID=412755 RepID=A0A0F9SCS8_9ZZZZ
MKKILLVALLVFASCMVYSPVEASEPNLRIEDMTEQQLYSQVNYWLKEAENTKTSWRITSRSNMAQVYQNELLLRSKQ